MPGAFARRLCSLPLLLGAGAVVWLGLPVWIGVALLMDAVRRRGLASLRVLAFAVTYVSAELLGVAALCFVWLAAAGDAQRLLEGTYGVQAVWTRALLRACGVIFQLRFDVEGDACVAPGPVLVLSRHASIVDTLLPSVFLGQRHGVRLRFVLKRELLWDPCLDIAGCRLPNHFVARRAEDSTEDRNRLAALAQGLSSHEGVLIFPEGTRFSPSKRQRALEQLRQRDPALHATAAQLSFTLPPRPGGVLALLDGAPEADLVFLAHSGLEGFAKVKDIWRGALLRRTVRVRCWRVPRSEVPTGDEARRAFLLQQWLLLDRRLAQMASG